MLERKKQIEQAIADAYGYLSEYDRKILLETDPLERAKHEGVQQQIKQRIIALERELAELDSAPAVAPTHTNSSPVSTSRSSHLFISYKRDVEPDEGLALQLFQGLSRRHSVFIDQTMPVGVNWREQIEGELGRSDFLITLLSARSIHSEMVEAEIALATRLAKENGGRPRILPIRLDFREPFPYPLSEYLNPINWALWQAPEDTPGLLAELERAISGGELNRNQASLYEFLSAAQTSAKQDELQPPLPAAQPSPVVSSRFGLAGLENNPDSQATGSIKPALEMPEGTMNLQSSFYVLRPTDTLALSSISQQGRGETITIKGPRQMGKSSLLIRTVEEATKIGKRVAFLDFQFFDRSALASADVFYKQFCAWLSDELMLDDKVDEFWSKPRGNSLLCTQYLGRYLLPTLAEPLVLAMDEVESLFDTPFRSDFFSMLRGWHNYRSHQPIWRQLDLVLVTSTEPYQLIENLNLSPFNVGQTLELSDFEPAQLTELNRRHGYAFQPGEEQQLFRLLGGQPYLTRRALYLVASGQASAAELFSSASDPRGPFGDHLRYHLFRLQSRAELVEGMRRVIRTNTCPDEAIFFRLQGAGLVKREGKLIIPRCQLYAAYFQEHL